MIMKAEDLVKHNDIFQMMKNNITKKTSSLPTMSSVDESKIYELEKDKTTIKKSLMYHSATNENHVIAICGII